MDWGGGSWVWCLRAQFRCEGAWWYEHKELGRVCGWERFIQACLFLNLVFKKIKIYYNIKLQIETEIRKDRKKEKRGEMLGKKAVIVLLMPSGRGSWAKNWNVANSSILSLLPFPPHLMTQKLL